MLAAILSIVSYVGFYFAIIDVPLPFRLPNFWWRKDPGFAVGLVDINGEWTATPTYHGLPEWFFAPIHELDRTRLRPHKWSGTRPNARTTELSFDWLFEKPTPELRDWLLGEPTPAPTQP